LSSSARGMGYSNPLGYNSTMRFMREKSSMVFQSDRVFFFLVLFRWASLLPALLTLLFGDQRAEVLPPALVFGITLLINLVVSIFNRPLNQVVTDHPPIFVIDLIVSAGILAVSGGSQSPYYLYALSPLLAGAFFFQMRGAVVASAFFTPLYLIGNYLNSNSDLPNNLIGFITQLAGIWLIPILFAYPSTLLRAIHQARDELSAARDELSQKHENLATAHRQLEIIHDLTVLLQAAPDLISVQERVLGAVTTDLGFSKAVVAMVDPAHEEIGGWLVYPPDPSFPTIGPLPLRSENGEIIRALLQRENFTPQDQTLIQDARLNLWLGQSHWYVMPLYLREHPVGALLVEESGLTPAKESTLMTVANQAALALGTTILCIDRARRLAVETERNRIARDIHDTVAQSLFGIVYSLDACITMLPQKAEDVRNELIELRSLANNAHEEVRRSVFDLWPSALTIELFMADLTNYVGSCCRPRTFSIIFNNNGDFNSLSPGMRRTVYRMAQEALANSAKHSGIQSARLCMNITNTDVHLMVSDEGKGFDPSIALSRSQNREHFGLHGIQERAQAMGGECEIISKPNVGTRIMVQLPIHGAHHHHA